MIALLLACAPEEGEPWPLAELHGFWHGEVTIGSEPRPVLASFVAVETLGGVVQGVIRDLPPLDGNWETRTFCGEPPDGWCVEGGGVHLERVEP